MSKADIPVPFGQTGNLSGLPETKDPFGWENKQRKPEPEHNEPVSGVDAYLSGLDDETKALIRNGLDAKLQPKPEETHMQRMQRLLRSREVDPVNNPDDQPGNLDDFEPRS